MIPINNNEWVNVLWPNNSLIIKLSNFNFLPIFLPVWQMSGNKLETTDKHITVTVENKSVWKCSVVNAPTSNPADTWVLPVVNLLLYREHFNINHTEIRTYFRC